MRVQTIGQELRVNNKNYNNKQPAFRRNFSEHVSWGANYVKESGTTNFKLFSFPDAKAVFVEVADKLVKGLGNIKDRIVETAAAAGGALAVTALDEKTSLYPMEHKGNGIFEANNIPAKADDKYRYVIVTKDNEVNTVKDPYAKKQENIYGWSSVYNPDNYVWKNTDWLEGKDARRITRKPEEPMRGLDKLFIDEVNIPTMSDEGTFEAAKARIDVIADRGIATAIELMPVENTYSMQWGYDGVDKFAVNEKLGGAKGLKELVDYAHGKGLNVIMDMVPNHMGPDGDYLAQTGPYEKGPGEYGALLNYEGFNNRYVRDWMTNAALWWVNEFKVDGLRLDMTKLCDSDYLLKQIADEVNEHNPEVFIIAEDGRDNKHSVTAYDGNNATHEKELEMIDRSIDDITNGVWHTTPHQIGYDSEWDFTFNKIMKEAITTPSPVHLAALDGALKNSHYRVKYVYSHDDIGNWDGTRYIPKVMSPNLNLYNRVNVYGDPQQGQVTAQTAQKLAELVVSKDFMKLTPEKLYEIEEQLNIRPDAYITKTDLINAFNTGVARQKLALGTVLTVPGPKMYFQGDDEADLSYFKFFRELGSDKHDRETDPGFIQREIAKKGYDTLESIARKDSILGRVSKEGMYKDLTENMIRFNKDLSDMVKTMPVLARGEIVATYNDYNHNVHIHQLKLDNDELVIIKNFGQGFHDGNYQYYGFPQNSKWEEIFNSDDVKYGGSGYSNAERHDINNFNQRLSLAPNSFLILRKIS